MDNEWLKTVVGVIVRKIHDSMGIKKRESTKNKSRSENNHKFARYR